MNSLQSKRKGAIFDRAASTTNLNTNGDASSSKRRADLEKKLHFIKIASSRAYPHVHRWFARTVADMETKAASKCDNSLKSLQCLQIPGSFQAVREIREAQKKEKTEKTALQSHVSIMTHWIGEGAKRWLEKRAHLVRSHVCQLQELEKGFLERHQKVEGWIRQGEREHVMSEITRFAEKRSQLAELSVLNKEKEMRRRERGLAQLKRGFKECIQEVYDVVGWCTLQPKCGSQTSRRRLHQLRAILGESFKKFITTQKALAHDTSTAQVCGNFRYSASEKQYGVSTQSDDDDESRQLIRLDLKIKNAMRKYNQDPPLWFKEEKRHFESQAKKECPFNVSITAPEKKPFGNNLDHSEKSSTSQDKILVSLKQSRKQRSGIRQKKEEAKNSDKCYEGGMDACKSKNGSGVASCMEKTDEHKQMTVTPNTVPLLQEVSENAQSLPRLLELNSRIDRTLDARKLTKWTQSGHTSVSKSPQKKDDARVFCKKTSLSCLETIGSTNEVVFAPFASCLNTQKALLSRFDEKNHTESNETNYLGRRINAVQSPWSYVLPPSLSPVRDKGCRCSIVSDSHLCTHCSQETDSATGMQVGRPESSQHKTRRHNNNTRIRMDSNKVMKKTSMDPLEAAKTAAIDSIRLNNCTSRIGASMQIREPPPALQNGSVAELAKDLLSEFYEANMVAAKTTESNTLLLGQLRALRRETASIMRENVLMENDKLLFVNPPNVAQAGKGKEAHPFALALSKTSTLSSVRETVQGREEKSVERQQHIVILGRRDPKLLATSECRSAGQNDEVDEQGKRTLTLLRKQYHLTEKQLKETRNRIAGMQKRVQERDAILDAICKYWQKNAAVFKHIQSADNDQKTKLAHTNSSPYPTPTEEHCSSAPASHDTMMTRSRAHLRPFVSEDGSQLSSQAIWRCEGRLAGGTTPRAPTLEVSLPEVNYRRPRLELNTLELKPQMRSPEATEWNNSLKIQEGGGGNLEEPKRSEEISLPRSIILRNNRTIPGESSPHYLDEKNTNHSNDFSSVFRSLERKPSLGNMTPYENMISSDIVGSLPKFGFIPNFGSLAALPMSIEQTNHKKKMPNSGSENLDMTLSNANNYFPDKSTMHALRSRTTTRLTQSCRWVEAEKSSRVVSDSKSVETHYGAQANSTILVIPKCLSDPQDTLILHDDETIANFIYSVFRNA